MSCRCRCDRNVTLRDWHAHHSQIFNNTSNVTLLSALHWLDDGMTGVSHLHLFLTEIWDYFKLGCPSSCLCQPPWPPLVKSVCLSVCFCFCLHPSALYPFPSVIPLTGQLQSSFWTCSSSCLFPSFHPLSRWINIYSTFHSLSVTKGCIYIVFLHAKTTTDIPPRSGQTWIVCFNSFRGCASTLAWYGFCIALWPRCCF